MAIGGPFSVLAENICQHAAGTGGPTDWHEGQHVEADVQGAHVEYRCREEPPHCRVGCTRGPFEGYFQSSSHMPTPDNNASELMCIRHVRAVLVSEQDCSKVVGCQCEGQVHEEGAHPRRATARGPQTGRSCHSHRSR